MTHRPLLALLLPLAMCVPLSACAAAARPPAPADPSDCSVRAEPGDDLQAAVDRVPNDGKPATVCLAAGEFHVTRLLSIQRDGLRLRGQGDATVLRMRDGVQQPTIVVGDYQNERPQRTIRDVSIERLQLVGGEAEKEFMPERPYLSNSLVVVRAGHNIRLSGLRASKCRSACLLSEYDSRDLLIERNDVSGAIWDGVSFNRTAKVRLIDNYIHDNVAAGITTEHLEDSEIRNNRLERNGSQGVYLADARRNVFAGNQFTGNKGAGVYLACSIRQRTPEILCWDNSMSQDNVFENNSFKGNPYTYTIGVDRAANCAGADFRPNLWRRSNQADASGVDIQPERYGRCVRFE
ncbi:right-handed parallel beta-helix repeat-containing protein [Xanthomonas sp. AmX2]|uniref:right-handed parallel beta-helix repeat-containing protein n=1 Tax=Xanthomonas sp. TaxID=29446 RepID=UPI00197CBEBB|nr:right-handed parallel beta-helix repeat-containing protein [Xanthomonas sp.]MBN6149014.1 right-handed parallel beta-helix repeat-containing protein [Xanthomonas sp.]